MNHIDPTPPGSSTPPGEPTLVITRRFEAPRELVWRCYTDPVHLVHFWGPHGSTCPLSEVDLRVGGRWRQVMRLASGSEYGYTSAYLEITRRPGLCGATPRMPTVSARRCRPPPC